jgi:hypothetical protein
MPDMRTALENALKSTINSWAEDDKPVTQPVNQNTPKENTMVNPNPVVKFEKAGDGRIRFVPSVGVTRAVFDAVHDNPGIPRQQLVDSLVAKGFKKSSVGSLITQNILGGIFKIDGHNRLTTTVKEYAPVPTTKKRAALRQAQKKAELAALKAASKTAKPKAVETKAVETKATTNTPSKGIAALKVDTGVLGVQVFDPKEFLNTLSIIQARELYDELKKVFGVI